jgi:acetyl esterase/lipase
MHSSSRFRPSSLVVSFLVLITTSSFVRAEEAKPARAFAVQTVQDVAYYEGPDVNKVRHRLDLYLPKDHKDYPVLFFVHGGAWRHGDKNQLGIYAGLGNLFARHGIGTVVINYRLSPSVKHPEHVKDVARAFAWTIKNVEKYGGRKDEVFVCGHSAGGHLVSLLCTDESYLKAEGLTSKAICGVISMSGVYLLPDGLMPSVFGTDPEARKQAAPISHVHKGLPPFLILYADKDLTGCDKEPAEKFCKALKDQGDEVEAIELTGSHHVKVMLDAATPDTTVSRAILDFIGKHVRNP